MVDGTFSRSYKDKKVLVTGHTGFKGSWLTEWLLMMGAKVTGLALAPATEPALFDQLGLAGRCDHRIGDIRERAGVSRIVHEVRPDVVFHLAAQPLVRRSYVQPLDTYETNVMGTANLLDALRDTDWPCAAVMITTDKVYENRECDHAYREGDPLGGYDPYSSSKACAELVIQSYRQSFFNPKEIETKHFPVVAIASARAGNVIGGGDWALDRIVPDCVRSLAKGSVIDVRNPDATRPWQHVLEPLGGYLLLGMKLHEAVSDPGSRGSGLENLASAFNFGPTLASNRAVLDLVTEILKHWPGEWKDSSDPRAPHEAGLLNLAVDKAARVLGWRPCLDFETTVAMTVAWYQNALRCDAQALRKSTQEQIRNYMKGEVSECR